MESAYSKFAAAAAAAIVMVFIGGWVHGAYVRYWLSTDPRHATATVIADASHDSVSYTYIVAGVTYDGIGQRDWRDPRFKAVGIGGRPPVWYSASRPWLSSLPVPEGTLYGFPFVLVASTIEVCLLLTVVWPRRDWGARPRRTGSAG